MEEIEQRKGWFGRNWKWAVPTGGCLLIIILLVVFAGSLFFGITSMMTDSQAYQDSMEAAKNNDALIELLGEPIETNGVSGGSLNINNGIKSAELSIPIKGPEGEATIFVVGRGMNDNWSYETMEVHIEGSREIIDLLETAPLLDQ
ncbi:MAG: cytochrome c oxidase assembly factor Coa1 family protein [Bacteroidota bacterium]